ncbi:MAG: UDP-3-O-(3-hydroxymyristoyl)glucosamine N-acyltransferase [Gammaproteobacteria bacterium]|uniref:UDP-3-O-(3-hydroxymyristoyl)glucosamine N-acyltransferase n=1 Tax=Rhodoferax sp. TaxID=50421 RepID=UPI001820F7B4|nr:UDP-3-O-(3-hydroxymyristoyl)glucosamine N-acyltransferase [Rhodoferax sp.]MBU3899040.1 UDP-3-O-(3-hydroxymyristoyl)glucosamine N-acyltransferase [Gammaproteobacteria bacterium]MBA3057660.1 UDP-3-O-(3-hydroxymyristoyl)glucosamine N-acyltransferase [Rhodoferax sp.]MBU4018483.1 UDP-3-O-(3-hydroxymyristoyl)glucosamine N-acyltransferase [Gammaproteobacteria bacterium]MBU4080495.1 UDP-3-O-(3-hydroxymyristoyl)glucosamine N-acyltransferase [Gammaproteobacteria bacterium]MBU4114434.1 UDP-3-O-(3-hydr
MTLLLGFIVESLGGELHGDASQSIEGLGPLESATPQQLSFLSHPKYQSQLAASRAACVIVAPPMRDAALARGPCIVTEQPYLYFARVTQLWKKSLPQVARAPIHPSAVIDPAAFVHPRACIGALCVIERGASIGADTVLKSRVTVSENCVIGERCLLHSGVVIGADGFGFAPNAGTWEKIEQLGAVRIGNDVEIGANTCIDRGALQDTVIEDGVKLDNLIQIGHNVHVGQHTAMAGCVGVAGSATIGAHCTLGGGAIVLGHLALADGVNISAASVVTRSLRKPGHYTGIFPIDDNAAWEKNAASLKQLHGLRDRIRVLEDKIRILERS